MWTCHPDKDKIVIEIKQKDEVTLTERDRAILMFSHLEENGSSNKSSASVADNFFDDGSIKLVVDELPSTDRHMPKSHKITINDYDRVYWLNFLIACEGQTATSEEEVFRSRSNAILNNAINDLEAFVEFYSPPMMGDPLMIDKHKVMRSAGFFQHTERLFNPTDLQMLEAIERAKEWIKVNQTDPEFKSLQINFCFAGHGGFDEGGKCGIEFKNKFMDANKLAKSIFTILPNKGNCDNRHRLDLFLDCCHAGAIAFEFLSAMKQFNEDRLLDNSAEIFDDGAPVGGIGFGRMFCSSMHDESSLESDKYAHGLFTYAFLNEFSTKPVCLKGMPNIGLKDIGWYSNGEQHPFFISFLRGANPDDADFIIKFPSLKYVSHFSPDTMKQRIPMYLPDGVISEDGLILDDAKFFISQLNWRRKMVEDVESQIIKNTNMSIEVSPDEYLKQEIHWF